MTMRTHQTMLYGDRVLPGLLTLTNQCPWRMEIYNTVLVARYHVEAAVRHGRCKPPRARMPREVKQPRTLRCLYPTCDYVAPKLAELQIHVKAILCQ